MNGPVTVKYPNLKPMTYFNPNSPTLRELIIVLFVGIAVLVTTRLEEAWRFVTGGAR